MRVLQICAAYKPAFIYGGPTMSVSMLSEQLAKAGLSTEVFTTTANGKSELAVESGLPVIVDGVRVTYFRRVTRDHTHLSPSLLKKLWKEAPGFDLVHIHTWWNLVSVFSCLVVLMRRVPVLLSPRGTLSPYSFQNKNIGTKQIIHSLLGKSLMNKCHVHVTSERERLAVAELIHPKSITILPNFVKLPGIKTYPEKAASPVFKLLFFSRIEEKKGLDILISALSLITMPYELTVAGDGDNQYIESLKMLAENDFVGDKINWIGFQNECKFDLLYGYDLFVLPSYDENFGNAVIESLSVGTPVLVSEQVGLADYVLKNNIGWTCHTDANSVAAAINNIAKNSQAELARIRKEAPGIIYEDFDEGKLVKKYIAVYRELIKQ